MENQAQADRPERVVLVVARDLLMSSKIAAVAKRLGVPVRLLRDPAALTPELPGLLALADLDLEGAIDALAAWEKRGGKPAGGFVQHVHTEVIHRARAAGIRRIIPRSQLEGVLPELLGGL